MSCLDKNAEQHKFAAHFIDYAVVMLDYHTGAIRSFVGSLDSPTAANPLNVVTQTARQVGLAFKPFVYTNAFAQDISPGEVVWYDSMLLAEANKPIKQFPGPPSGVVKKTVSYPALTTTDWYLAS